MESEKPLPEGWVSVRIDEIAEVNPGKPPKDLLPPDALVSFVPMPAVDAEKGAITEPEVRPYHIVRSGYTAFRDDDLIVAKITPCMENGKAAVARDLVNGLGFGSSEFHVLRSRGAALPEYLYHFVRQLSFRDDAAKQMTGSVGQKRVPADFIKSSVIPLPPLAEQRRIVAQLEALLADMERVRGRLDAVAATMQRFRRAIFEAAIYGHLTEGWGKRAEINPDHRNSEIHIGETGFNRKDRDPFPIATKEDFSQSLPSDWHWVELKDVCVEVTDGDHQPPPKSNSGIPFITISNISSGSLDFSRTMYVPNSYFEKIPLAKKPILNDILYSVTGATYGIPVLVEVDRLFCFQRHIALIRPSPSISPKYLWIALKSITVYNQATQVATGIAQPTVPLRGLRKIRIPVPPLAEQHEIVRRVEALFALADRIEGEVAGARERVEALTQAVLAKAFRGELVPTEAELARREGRRYEPAGALLERMRVGTAVTSTVKSKSLQRRKGAGTVTLDAFDNKFGNQSL